MPQLFGAKLRHIRRLHNLTQGELANDLSLASYTYIHRLEADQRAPSLVMVVRLAMYFDQPTDYFLRDTFPVEATRTSTITKPLTATEQPMQLLGTKLRKLRVQKGWNQTELTRQLGLSRPGYVNNLEASRRAPSLELIVQIADLFEVTTDYLTLDIIPVSPLPLSTLPFTASDSP
jgi:transcriptional regulator with XRE-family HTH domain